MLQEGLRLTGDWRSTKSYHRNWWFWYSVLYSSWMSRSNSYMLLCEVWSYVLYSTSAGI